MNRSILKQFADIRREIRDQEKEIFRLGKRIDILKKEEVADTVVGSRADLTIGAITVRGYPQKEYRKKIQDLQRKKVLMEQKRTELLKMKTEAEEYIQSIKEIRLRQIIKYRYMDDLSWQQVAAKMGCKYTAESCRKRAERFMSDKIE